MEADCYRQERPPGSKVPPYCQFFPANAVIFLLLFARLADICNCMLKFNGGQAGGTRRMKELSWQG